MERSNNILLHVGRYLIAPRLFIVESIIFPLIIDILAKNQLAINNKDLFLESFFYFLNAFFSCAIY